MQLTSNHWTKHSSVFKYIELYTIPRKVENIALDLEHPEICDIHVVNISRILPEYFTIFMLTRNILPKSILIQILSYLGLPAKYIICSKHHISYFRFKANLTPKLIHHKNGFTYKWLIGRKPTDDDKESFDWLVNRSLPIQVYLIKRLVSFDSPEKILPHKLLTRSHSYDSYCFGEMIKIYAKCNYQLTNNEIFNFMITMHKKEYLGEGRISQLYEAGIITREYYYLLGLKTTKEGNEALNSIIDASDINDLILLRQSTAIIIKKSFDLYLVVEMQELQQTIDMMIEFKRFIN